MKRLALLILLTFFIILNLNAQLLEHFDFPYGGSYDQICESKNGTLFIGCGNGLFISEDKAKSWKKINESHFINLTIDSNDILYTIIYDLDNSSISKSTDYGKTWNYLCNLNYFSTKHGKLALGLNNEILIIKYPILQIFDKDSIKYFKILSDTIQEYQFKGRENNDEIQIKNDSIISFKANYYDSIGHRSIIEYNYISNIFRVVFKSKTIDILSYIYLNQDLILISSSSGILLFTITTQKIDTLNSNLQFKELVKYNKNKIYGLNNKIYFSKDNGNKWEILETNIPNDDIYDFFESKSGDYYARNNISIYKYDIKNQLWSRSDSGFCNTSFGSLLNDKNKIYASNFDFYISTNYGLNWKKISDSLYTSNIQKNNDGNLFSIKSNWQYGNQRSLYRSSNEGSSWEKILGPINITINNIEKSYEIDSYIFNQYNNLVVIANKYILYGYLGGKQWSDLSITPVSFRTLYRNSDNQTFAFYNKSIYKNNGAIWEEYIIDELPSNSWELYGELFFHKNRKVGFLRFYWGIPWFRTFDNGITWNRVDGFKLDNYPPEWGITKIFGWDSHDDLYGISLDGNIYKSTNDGDTWMLIDTTLNKFDNKYQFQYSSGWITDNDYLLIIAGPGYYLSKNKVTSIPIENKIENNFSISPNPATDYIEINVGAQRAVPENVAIFDLLGVEITTPSLRDTPPYQGGEIVRVDVSHLSPGVYFVWVGDIVQKFVKF